MEVIIPFYETIYVTGGSLVSVFDKDTPGLEGYNYLPVPPGGDVKFCYLIGFNSFCFFPLNKDVPVFLKAGAPGTLKFPIFFPNMLDN
jgi:hypothetical protein